MDKNGLKQGQKHPNMLKLTQKDANTRKLKQTQPKVPPKRLSQANSGVLVYMYLLV